MTRNCKLIPTRTGPH